MESDSGGAIRPPSLSSHREKIGTAIVVQRVMSYLAMLSFYKGILIQFLAVLPLIQLPAITPGKRKENKAQILSPPLSILETPLEFQASGFSHLESKLVHGNYFFSLSLIHSVLL